MQQVRALRTAIAAAVMAGALVLSGCAATQQSAALDSATGTAGSAAIPAAFNMPASGGGGAAGGGAAATGGGAAVAPSQPATWPLDVPVPAGKLQGSTTSAGRWTLLLLENGSAAQTLASAGAVYRAAGYTAASAALWNKGNRHITLVVQNRDHSATKTFLAIQLTTP